MKNVVIALALALGLPFLGLLLTFVYVTSPRWAEADYDNLITYDTYPAGPANPETLTIVTYNLGYLSGLTNQQPVERDRQHLDTHLTTAIATLKSLQADILGLQEIDFDAYRTFNLNQQYAIASALETPYAAIAVNWDKRYVPFPYWPPQAHFRGVTSGQAVLSRYPIRRNDRLVLPRVPSHNPLYEAFYLDRVAQVTEIDVSGRPLLVINVHLEAFDQPTRRHQTELVRQLAEQYAQRWPVLLVGDFNSDSDRPEEADHPAIDTLLTSTVLASALAPQTLAQPQGATFPADQPQHTLDYIFYTPATLELLDAGVVTTAGQASDHLPVQAQVRFRSVSPP
ncbi:MAG TPA: endonuclease/exonuclease/phosphatase family protein [Leptolyngbyaceae cyanobacterium M65_K2018_010]|nr:endonuclease/exonuclease/phosphatase family protein [Leptolyngbyaceae cyanobacterium M65_K2018_010]